jgi:hypothetical protein
VRVHFARAADFGAAPDGLAAALTPAFADAFGAGLVDAFAVAFVAALAATFGDVLVVAFVLGPAFVVPDRAFGFSATAAPPPFMPPPPVLALAAIRPSR